MNTYVNRRSCTLSFMLAIHPPKKVSSKVKKMSSEHQRARNRYPCLDSKKLSSIELTIVNELNKFFTKYSLGINGLILPYIFLI